MRSHVRFTNHRKQQFTTNTKNSSDCPPPETPVSTVDLKQAQGGTSDAAFEASGLKISKADVKEAQGELGIRTSRKTKERVANMHNSYAQKILAACTNAPAEFKALAMQYASELPKAAKGNDLMEYKAACEAKLDAFRQAAMNEGLAQYLEQMEQNSEARFEEGEANANARAADIKQTVVDTGEHVIEEVNANTNQKVDDAANRINQHTTRTTNSAVRRIGNAINNAAEGIKEYVTTEHGITRDFVMEEGRMTRQHITDEVNRGVKEVNAHTTNEVNKGVKEVKHNAQQNQVLNAKRQTISDMLMNEVNEKIPGAGHYRDKTVKWLGSSADRIMASTELTFEQKKEALDELTRMVDEENIISDGDRGAFEEKYFYETKKRERGHI